MLTQKTRMSLALIFACYALWFVVHMNDSHTPQAPSDSFTMNEMVGTWTDPKGPTGNHVSFIMTKIKDAPGDPIAMISSAYETKGEIKDLFGYQSTPVTYGLHSHAPVVIVYVCGPADQTLLSLKAVDHNHLTVQALRKTIYGANGERTNQILPATPVNLVRIKEPDYKPNYK